MVRTVSGRLRVAAAMLIGAVLALTVGGAALAAPKPPPASMTITGQGLAKPLVIRSDTDADAYSAVSEQVSWLGGPGQATAVTTQDLGPKYTVVVSVGNVAKQTFDLYPLAKGGPRACRPAKQPDAKRNSASPAWFFGRLSMSESLLTAGVPLPTSDLTVTGGTGGGERAVPDKPVEATKNLDDVVGNLRQLLLLNVGVIIFITGGLAGIALLVRRRTR